MQIKEWRDKFRSEIEEGVDNFLEEHGFEYITPTPLQPDAIQLKRLRRVMVEKLCHDEWDIKNGLNLILNQFPKRLKSKEWERVLDELYHVEMNALNYFNSSDRHEKSTNTEPQTQIADKLGISMETFQHCRNLLFDLFEEGNHQNALDLSILIATLFQTRIIGWIGVGKSYDCFGEHFKAIEVYKRVHNMFPYDPISRIFCAWSYLSVNRPILAKSILEEASLILETSPQAAEVWNPVVESIEKQIALMKK